VSPLESIDTIQDFSVEQGDKIEVSAARFGVVVNDTSKFSFSNNRTFVKVEKLWMFRLTQYNSLSTFARSLLHSSLVQQLWQSSNLIQS